MLYMFLSLQCVLPLRQHLIRLQSGSTNLHCGYHNYDGDILLPLIQSGFSLTHALILSFSKYKSVRNKRSKTPPCKSYTIIYQNLSAYKGRYKLFVLPVGHIVILSLIQSFLFFIDIKPLNWSNRL